LPSFVIKSNHIVPFFVTAIMSSSASPTNARSSAGGDDFADSSVVINPNVDFVGSKRWWSAVMLGIYLTRSFIAALPIDQRYGWMWLHLFHCIVRTHSTFPLGLSLIQAYALSGFISTLFQFSFFVMHWSKGTPNSAADQGKWNKSTWWEQLDNGEQYTPTRKFLTILAFIPCVGVPIVFLFQLCNSHVPFISGSSSHRTRRSGLPVRCLSTFWRWRWW
jgi:hypothetical protein